MANNTPDGSLTGTCDEVDREIGGAVRRKHSYGPLKSLPGYIFYEVADDSTSGYVT